MGAMAGEPVSVDDNFLHAGVRRTLSGRPGNRGSIHADISGGLDRVGTVGAACPPRAPNDRHDAHSCLVRMAALWLAAVPGFAGTFVEFDAPDRGLVPGAGEKIKHRWPGLNERNSRTVIRVTCRDAGVVPES